MTAASNDGDRPALRVVGGGEPTAEELAALVLAVAAVATRPAADSAATAGRREIPSRS